MLLTLGAAVVCLLGLVHLVSGRYEPEDFLWEKVEDRTLLSETGDWGSFGDLEVEWRDLRVI